MKLRVWSRGVFPIILLLSTSILLIYGTQTPASAQSAEDFVKGIFGKLIESAGKEKRRTEKIQERLSILGFYDGDVDGSYGEGTIRAVRAFQRSIGVGATGRLSKRQRKILATRAAAESNASIADSHKNDDTDYESMERVQRAKTLEECIGDCWILKNALSCDSYKHRRAYRRAARYCANSHRREQSERRQQEAFVEKQEYDERERVRREKELELQDNKRAKQLEEEQQKRLAIEKRRNKIHEAKIKGSEYASRSKTSWHVLRQQNELTEKEEVVVYSDQKSPGIIVQVIGECIKRGSVFFRAVLFDKNRETSVKFANVRSEFNGVVKARAFSYQLASYPAALR